MEHVIFVWDGLLPFHLKAVPKYYDIPVSFSQGQNYSQAAYLDLSPNSTWDGNDYGDAISLSIYEHDEVTVKQTTQTSITVTNSTKISNKLPIGEAFETAADFSNSVSRTSSTTLVLEAEKDVELGTRIVNYYRPNVNNNGYFLSTGAITTHFAYYY